MKKLINRYFSFFFRKKKKQYNIDDSMKKIIDVVKDYLTRETNNALLITGQWGVGKTYFFNNILSKQIEKTHIKGNTDSNYMSVRISLFGVTNIDDIGRRMFTEIFPFVEKGIRIGEGLAKLLLSIPMTKEFISSDKLSELISEIKVDNKIKNSMINSVANRIVICFDDIERVSKDFYIQDLIGYINNLTENYDFKVLIIGNTNKIKPKKFNKIKEKLIGVEIEYNNDIESTFNNIVKDKFHEEQSSRNKYEAFLEERKEFICSFFNGGYKNIRTLLIILECYKHIYSAIKELTPQAFDEYREDLMKNTLLFTIAVVIEFKEGKLTKKNKNELNDNIISLLEIEGNVLDNTDKSSLSKENSAIESINKYYNKEQKYFFYESIFDYIVGVNTFIKNTFIEEVKKKYGVSEDEKVPEHYRIYNKISPNYRFFLKDEEYNELLTSVLDYVDQGLYNLGDYFTIYQLALSCGNPLELDENKLKERIKKGIKKGEEHFMYDPNLEWKYDEINSYSFKPEEKEMIDFCREINRRRKEKQNQEEINYLKGLLNKGDFNAFNEKIKEKYKKTAIFNEIGADLVFKLYKENLKFRYKMYELFFYRYKEHNNIIYLELNFITKLNELISGEADRLQKGVEWNLYNIFSSFLNKVNERYEKIETIVENSLR